MENNSRTALIRRWKSIIKQFPEANFLQSPAYGEMSELLGEKVVFEDFDDKGWMLAIIRDAKRGRYLEIPCGPLIDWDDNKLAWQALARIKEIARAEKCVFVRMRPQLTLNKQYLRMLEDLGLRKSPMHLAAEHTVMIGLEQTEEELLAKMRRQTRYEVRRSAKQGILVTRDNSEEIFREFHAVQLATAKRQRFVPPSLEVLMAEREAFRDQIWIYVARTGDKETSRDKSNKRARSETPEGKGKTTNGEPIAYGLVIHDGREGDYYEAASTDLNRKMPGAYALLWRAMRDLKKEGCERFNLWGIAPKGQPGHRYAGVTTFKTGFGGEVVEYVPAHDLVISRVRYLKNWLVEAFRKKWRHL